MKLNPGDRTPEQLEGMQDEDAAPKFRNIGVEELEELQQERQKAKDEMARSEPKWSNAEVYTAAPPQPDGSSKKRVDVVKMIRLAKLQAEKDKAAVNEAAQGDDFISFGQEDVPEVPANAPAAPKAMTAPVKTHAVSHPPQSAEVIDLTDETISHTPVIASFPPVNDSIAEKLQSRKRKRADDEAEDASGIRTPKKRAKKGRLPEPNGSVLGSWGRSKSDNAPWFNDGHGDSSVRLHREICDFYEFVRPQEFEHIVRLDTLNRIRACVKTKYPDCEVYAFGSFAAGLYLPDADLDLVVLSHDLVDRQLPSLTANNVLRRFETHFKSQRLAEPDSIELIIGAKVPLVKFRERVTGLRVDLSFENLTGPRAIATFDAWKRDHLALAPIALLIKQFLTMRGLNEVQTGGLGGFSVFNLIVAALQNMTRVQTGELNPTRNLGEVLLEFLELYGKKFNLKEAAIDCNSTGLVNKVSQAALWRNSLTNLPA